MIAKLRMAMVTAAVVAAVAAVAVAPSAGFAQTCDTPQSGTATVRTCSAVASVGTLTVNKLGTLALSSVATVALTSPVSADYDATLKAEPSTNTRTATIKANAPWSLGVAPNTASNPPYWT